MGVNISQEAHNKLIRFVKAIQDKQRDFSTFKDKLIAIDKAYAKHEIKLKSSGEDQPDETAIKVPLVNSEIDDIASFLTSIFVNVTPLFPVTSEEGKPEAAMQMQAIIARDAKHQRWGRQLLKFMTCAARYNVQGIEVEKNEQIDTAVENSEDSTSFEIIAKSRPTTTLFSLDMYNALFDYRCDPADVAFDGEYAGYNSIMSKTKLKKLGNKYSLAGTHYNLKEAYESSMQGTEIYWNEKPDISTVATDTPADQEDWFDWVGIIDPMHGKLSLSSSSYFVTRLYVRIIPSDFGINIGSGANTPTIIKLTIVNNKWIINWQEIITPLDVLPILFCDTREDGFGYQTKSAGENVVPYQQVATELLNTRLQGSKRMLNDRAIFDPQYLDYQQVNSANPSAKIPLKVSLRGSGDKPPIASVYHQIPFESQGTIGVIGDMQQIIQIKDQVNGNNFAFSGRREKGNRTAEEFGTLNSNANRKALPSALRIEEQVMIPMKLIIKLNILTDQVVDQKVLNTEDGHVSTVNTAELRQAMLDFRITDGLVPKEAIKDPEVLSTAIQFLQNNEELNAEYSTGAIFGDMMAQWDINVSKHKRQQTPNATPTGQPNAPAPAANSGNAGAGNQAT